MDLFGPALFGGIIGIPALHGNALSLHTFMF